MTERFKDYPKFSALDEAEGRKTKGKWYTVDQCWLPRDTNTYLIAGHHDPHRGKCLLDADHDADGWDGQIQADYEFCEKAANTTRPLLDALAVALQALEFYSEKNNWNGTYHLAGQKAINLDSGENARAALTRIKELGGGSK